MLELSMHGTAVTCQLLHVTLYFSVFTGGYESRALYILGKYSPTEPYPPNLSWCFMLATDGETGPRERVGELLMPSTSNTTRVASRAPPKNLAFSSPQEATVLTGCLTDVTIRRSGRCMFEVFARKWHLVLLMNNKQPFDKMQGHCRKRIHLELGPLVRSRNASEDMKTICSFRSPDGLLAV